MDETSKKILTKIGITFENENQLNEILIPRETFINDSIYNSVKDHISELKTIFSSSSQFSNKWRLRLHFTKWEFIWM